MTHADDTASPHGEDITELIEASSLGTPSARALRETVTAAEGEALARRAALSGPQTAQPPNFAQELLRGCRQSITRNDPRMLAALFCTLDKFLREGGSLPKDWAR